MQAWHFTETAYPFLPPADQYELVRVNLPNRIYDPQKGAALYDRYLKEWQIAEEEGVEIMMNEHHQTVTCVDPAAPLMMAARGARHLEGADPDPRQSDRQPPPAGAHRRRDGDGRYSLARTARGRVRARRAVRGSAGEQQPGAHERAPLGGARPHRQGMDEPRRPVQPRGPLLPLPRRQHLAAAVAAAASAGVGQHDERVRRRSASARNGYVQATFLTGYEGTRAIYDSYRRGWREAGRGQDVPIDRLAYAALVYVSDNEAKAYAGADKLLWYLNANKVPRHFAAPPGYVGVAASVAALKAAGTTTQGDHANFGRNMNVETAMERGLMFCGTPDQVHAQIKKFYDHVGGFGHLLIMGQAGFLEHDDTVHGIRMFAREVYPRLKEEYPGSRISGIFEDRHEPVQFRGVAAEARGTPLG